MPKPEFVAGVEDVDLEGKTVLVTGSTSGIGKETALSLGRLGAHVLVHGRDESRGRAVVNTLEETVETKAELYIADFSDLDAVEQLGEEVASDVEQLDILINNAGGYFREQKSTDDGIEYTFVVNHLAPYVLTATLLPRLRNGERISRIVNVASSAHNAGTMDLTAVTENPQANWESYSRSKLANIQYTKALSRRVNPDTVVTNCLHPGVITGSGFLRNTPLPDWLTAKIGPFLPGVKTTKEGAATSVFVATNKFEDTTNGRYYSDCSEEKPNDDARDEDQQEELWSKSEELTGVSYPFE